MRRLRNLLLILTSISLASCNEKLECINHIDSDHNGKCDVCLKEVSVTHTDSNNDGKCDVCGASIEHLHIDTNHDGNCDICEKEVTVTHVDADHNGKCDVCQAEMSVEHIDTNQDCICDICHNELRHEDKNKDNYCDICGSFIHTEITIDSYLITNEWGPGLKDYVGFVIGDENNDLVPQMPAENGYECYLEEIPYTDGSGSQLACVINCYTFDLEDAIDNYSEILYLNGFYLGSSSDYGYKLLSETSDLIVQYSIVQVKGVQFFELIIYEAETRMKEWPSEQLSILIGEEIPVFECESYEFYYYLDEVDYLPVAIVYDHNTGLNGLVEYHNQIMATGNYTLVANTADGYEYLSKDGKIELKIYPTSDEYNRDSIYITIKNNWPYFYTLMMLGEDIPCYNMQIMEFMFQDIDGDGTAEYLTIFFDGVNESDFASYCEQFVRAGWHINETESNNTYKLFEKKIEGIDKEIEVIYNETYGSICVAFK